MIDWKKLEPTQKKLKDDELLSVISKKSFFGHTDMEYLGFWVTRDRIRPINKKVEDMVNMTPKKTSKTGVCIHRLGELLQGYVGQNVTFNTPFNCAYIKQGKV